MSNANEVRLVAKSEGGSYGVDPGGSNWITVRFTSESLQLEANNIQSAEIVNTRQVSDLVRVSARASGDINGELSSRTYDPFIASALYGTWAAPVASHNGSIDISGQSGNTATITADTLTPFTNVVVGDYMILSNFTDAGNNGVVRVRSKTSSTVISGSWLKSTPVNTSNDTADIAFFGKLVNGTTQTSYAMQREYTDLGTTINTLFLGLIPDQMTIQAAVDNIITIGFTFLGATQQSTTTRKTADAATTTQVLNTVDHVYGTVRGDDITETNSFQIIAMNLQTSNNLAERRVIGQFAAHSIRAGVFSVTGGFTSLFLANTIVDKFLAGTTQNAAIVFNDTANGDYLIFDIQRLRYSQAPAVTPGQNQDVVLELQFQGLRNSTTGTTLQIFRHQP